MQSKRLIPLALAALLAACAPSPTYVATVDGGTPGEVPRDGRGDPLWGRIPAPPPAATPAPAIDTSVGPPIVPLPPV